MYLATDNVLTKNLFFFLGRMSESVNTKLTVLLFFSSKVSDFIKIFDSCCKTTIRIKEDPILMNN